MLKLTGTRISCAAIALMAALCCVPGIALAQQAPTQTAQEATSAAVNAAQLLFEAKQYQAARDLLRGHLDDGRAAVIYVRSGLALGSAGPDDLGLMQAQADKGSAVAGRILGDLLRNDSATGGKPDPAAAEAAYRHALDLGDKVSELRIAQLLAATARYPEAIAAYKALLDDFPEQETRYLALAVTRGNLADPAELELLLGRIDQLSATDPLAARTAATVFERGAPGIEKDPARAVEYAKRAAALGVTDLGLDAAANCDTCSTLDRVTLLKAATTLDPEQTAATLEQAIGVGLYADSYEIFARLDKSIRDQMITRFVEHYTTLSNPVVGFTQAMLASEGLYKGKLDGQLGSETLAAAGAFARSSGITLVRFDAPLVLALFQNAG